MYEPLDDTIRDKALKIKKYSQCSLISLIVGICLLVISISFYFFAQYMIKLEIIEVNFNFEKLKVKYFLSDFESRMCILKMVHKHINIGYHHQRKF